MTAKPEASAQGALAMTMPAGIGHDLNGPQTHAEAARVGGGYESLDVDGTKETFEELNAVLDDLATAAAQTLDQMVPHLAEMQSLLSQRGLDRKKVLKTAGLPTWTKWAKAFAAKLDRSLRTVQERIRQFRSGRQGGTSSRSARTGNRKRVKLDARQQAALVRAQLATSDLAAALEKGGDWKSALAEYKKVAVSPEKLDGYMEAFNSEPDWKSALSQLVSALEPSSDALPASARTALNTAKRLLGGDPGRERLALGKPRKAASPAAPVPKRAKGNGAPRPEKSTNGDARNSPASGGSAVHASAVASEGRTPDAPGLAAEGYGPVLPEETSLPATAASSQSAGPTDAADESRSVWRNSHSPVRITMCPPALGSEEGGGEAPAAPVGLGSRQGDFARNASGRWEYDPVPN